MFRRFILNEKATWWPNEFVTILRTFSLSGAIYKKKTILLSRLTSFAFVFSKQSLQKFRQKLRGVGEVHCNLLTSSDKWKFCLAHAPDSLTIHASLTSSDKWKFFLAHAPDSLTIHASLVQSQLSTVLAYNELCNITIMSSIPSLITSVQPVTGRSSPEVHWASASAEVHWVCAGSSLMDADADADAQCERPSTFKHARFPYSSMS